MSKGSKASLAIACVMITSIMVAGCGQNSSKSTSANSNSSKKQYTFEYIPQQAIPFYNSVQNGIKDAAQKFGNVTVKYEAPKSMTDNAAQLTMFNNAVASHVDGIILSPQNPVAFVKPIQEAIKSGIPVICVDTGVTPNVADSYITTSNVDASKKLAQYMKKLVNGKGKQLVVNFNHSSSTAIDRQDGWQKEMDSSSEIKSLGAQLTNSDPGVAKSIVSNFYQKDNNMNLIFGTNYMQATAAGDFVKNNNLKGKLFVAGFDVDEGVLNDLKEGYISATAAQSPYDMGYKAVQELMDLKSGKSVPKEVNTDTFILTPDNINSPDGIKAIKQYMPDYKN